MLLNALLMYWLSCRFINKMQTDLPGAGTKDILQVLCYVYALSLVSTHAGDFLGTGHLSSKQVALAKTQLRTLSAKVGSSECFYLLFQLKPGLSKIKLPDKCA
jgi:hypothetical protein